MRRTLFATLLTGCLAVPSVKQPKCTSDSDCNTAAGEVCDHGTCFGNPPPGPFAAALGPPSDRTDLVASEIPNFAIPSSGWLGDLVLDAAVTFSGRVEAFCPTPMVCDNNSVAATITVTRPSLFPGGPGFRAITHSKAGIARGGDSFSVIVPRSSAGEPDYAVAIVPEGRADAPPSDGSTSPAELYPPARMMLSATSDVTQTILLGSEGSQTITGSLMDNTGHPLKSYRVVALGQLGTGAPVGEVSTVAYVTAGQYSITLSDGITGTIELVAKSYDTNTVAPTYHVGGLAPIAAVHPIGQPANCGNPVTLTIPFDAVADDLGGKIIPAAGARVRVSGSYTSVLNGNFRTEVSVETTTGTDGVAHLTVLDGSALLGTYRMRVVPTASSSYGVIFDQELAIGLAGRCTQTASGIACTKVRMPRRVVLNGTAVDVAGNPMGSVTVTAHPSLRFAWSLDTAPQSFLAEIPTATAITPEKGTFAVYVDPLIAGVWGYYDLDFEPPVTSGAPRWTVSNVAIVRDLMVTTVTLTNVTIPDAASIHGRITDAGREPIASGELRVFVPSLPNPALCTQVAHAPDDCAIPAQLVGHGTSDDTGTVKLTLPRP